MHHSHEPVALVEDRHRHDAMLFHTEYYRTGQLIVPRDLWVGIEHLIKRNGQDIWLAFHGSSQITCCHESLEPVSGVDHDRNASTLREEYDGVPHGGADVKHGETIALHHLFHAREQATADGAPRMQAGEILPLESLL